MHEIVVVVDFIYGLQSDAVASPGMTPGHGAQGALTSASCFARRPAAPAWPSAAAAGAQCACSRGPPPRPAPLRLPPAPARCGPPRAAAEVPHVAAGRPGSTCVWCKQHADCCQHASCRLLQSAEDAAPTLQQQAATQPAAARQQLREPCIQQRVEYLMQAACFPVCSLLHVLAAHGLAYCCGLLVWTWAQQKDALLQSLGCQIPNSHLFHAHG